MTARIQITNIKNEVLLELDSPIIGGRYTIVNNDGTSLPDSSPSSPIRPEFVGRGGYGMVLRATDRHDLHRAVKLVSRSLAPRSALTDVTETLSTFPEDVEIAATNERPFKHVNPILDSGKDADAAGRQYLYYVSPFIPGPTLVQYFRTRLDGLTQPLLARDRHSLRDTLLLLIADILAGVVELHDAGVVHFDIKPGNALVLGARNPNDGRCRDRVFLIDLGAAKTFGRAHHAQPTPLARTPFYFPDSVLPLLKADVGRGVFEYSQLTAEVALIIDLFGVGRTLESIVLDRFRREPRLAPKGVPLPKRTSALVHNDAAREELWRQLLEEDFALIEHLIDRLMGIELPAFESAADALHAFEAIQLRCSRGHLASSLLTDQSRAVRIRMPGGLVRIAPPLDRIVDHPTFQRLRRLNQLGLVSEIFPDATHTRFTHSVHTYHVAKQLVHALTSDTTFRFLCTRHDVDQILIAALLHDIGQYPFSHAIEDLRKLADRSPDDPDASRLSTIRHDQELAATFLARPGPGGRSSIGAILGEEGYDQATITYMFQKSAKDWTRRPIDNLGRDIVSGVIDADRLSYLMLDSARTGVRFGAGVDLGSLAEALTVYYESPRPDGQARVGLGIEEHGASAVEVVLSAVFWMYKNVYWRHTNRAFEAAVKFAMRRLVASGAMSFSKFTEDNMMSTDWSALCYLEAQLAKTEADGTNPLSELVAHHRVPYRRVLTLARRNGDAGLYDRIMRGISCQRSDGLVEAIRDALPAGARARDGEILVDVPLKRRLASPATDADTVAEVGASSHLWVRLRDVCSREELRWMDIRDYSDIVRQLGQAENTTSRKVRVFVSRALLNRLQHDVRRRVGASVRSALDAATGSW